MTVYSAIRQGFFQNGGKLFVLAMDHAQTGIMEGLTDVKATMRLCADTELDGFLVNVEPREPWSNPR
jgi:DhnA family fructose-bisphosphate aldolase class Ia